MKTIQLLRLISIINSLLIIPACSAQNPSESLLEDVLEDLSVNNGTDNSVNTPNWENELYLSWCIFHHKYLPSEFLKCKKSRWRGGERHRISETALRHFPTKIDKRKTAKAL